MSSHTFNLINATTTKRICPFPDFNYKSFFSLWKLSPRCDKLVRFLSCCTVAAATQGLRRPLWCSTLVASTVNVGLGQNCFAMTNDSGCVNTEKTFYVTGPRFSSGNKIKHFSQKKHFLRSKKFDSYAALTQAISAWSFLR